MVEQRRERMARGRETSRRGGVHLFQSSQGVRGRARVHVERGHRVEQNAGQADEWDEQAGVANGTLSRPHVDAFR